MPKVLTQAQVRAYWEQGFIAPIDVFCEEEADAYRQRLEAAERDYPEHINATNRNNVHLVFPFLDELVFHPVVVGAVQDLLGPDLSLWGSVLFIKEPQSSAYVSWHQDATYMGLKPHDFVTPWIALTPSDRESGCMSMIPGSHRDAIRSHEDTFAEDNILTRGQVIADADTQQAVDLILRPGQMSLHHAQVIHASQPNKSQRRRIGVALQSYMPNHVRQTVAKNYWLPVSGAPRQGDWTELHRPVGDCEAGGVAERALADQNFADILYHGARQRARLLTQLGRWWQV